MGKLTLPMAELLIGDEIEVLESPFTHGFFGEVIKGYIKPAVSSDVVLTVKDQNGFKVDLMPNEYTLTSEQKLKIGMST